MRAAISVTATSLIGLGLVYALLPFQAMSFGAGPEMVTLLLTVDTVTILLTAPLLGSLSDRWGRKPVILLGLAAGPVAYLLMAYADSLAWLFASRVFAGLANAVISVIQAHLADQVSPRDRAHALAGINACFGFAFVVGPLIALATLGSAGNDYKSAALTAFGFSAFAVLLAAVFLGGRTTAARPTDKAVAPTPMGRLRPALILALAAMVLVAFVYEGLVTTLGLWGRDVLAWDARETAIAFAAAGLAAMAAWPAMRSRAFRRLGDQGCAALGGGLLVVGLLPFSAFWEPLAAGSALPIAAMALNGFAIVIGLSALQALVSNAAAAGSQGRIMGSAHGLASGARILGPLWAGYLFAGWGAHWPAISGIALLGLAGLVATLWPTPWSAPESERTG
ncbi:MAG: MFS transporter [Rhodospirillales bacterium]